MEHLKEWFDEEKVTVVFDSTGLIAIEQTTGRKYGLVLTSKYPDDWLTRDDIATIIKSIG